ncbi:MAG: hypothetical protein FJ117_12445 [Deltaproteobacteria bacterium]|nr:hypothetical protein [Deltaproteobacteria bacterium]
MGFLVRGIYATATASKIGHSRDSPPCDDEKELRLGGQARRVSSVRAKVAWQLSREYGIPMAEIARHVGVCTSAIANAIRKIEMENMK